MILERQKGVALWLAASWLLSTSCTTPLAGAEDSKKTTAVRDVLVIRHVLSGSLVAEQAVELSAPDVGIYPLQVRWLAPQGSQVKQGSRVVELDNSTLVQRLEELERQVDQAETGLDIAVSTAVTNLAQAQFDLLQKDTARKRAKIEADLPAGLRSDLEYAKLQLELRKADLEQTEAVRAEGAARENGQAEIDIARIALQRARQELVSQQRKIDRLEILAPSDGIVVVQRNWREDRVFESGDNVFPGNTLVRLPNLETLYVRGELYDVDDGAIEPGLEATVELDAVPGTEIRGRVREIDAIAQQTSRRSLRRVFGVIVEIDAVQGVRLLPGMSARVVVERRISKAADGEAPILVPRSTLDLSTAVPGVLMADGEIRAVRIGACSNTHCIVDEGVEAGEVLAPLRREAEL